MKRSYTIAVLGGGLAGCVAARGLKELGHEVVLLTRDRRGRTYEGMSQRTVDGLKFAGFKQSISLLGPEVERIAYWNGKSSAANREYIVERAEFDATLQKDARDSGVEVIRTRVEPIFFKGEKWKIPTRRENESKSTLAADFVIEARGGQAPLDGEKRELGPKATTLIQSWQLAERRPPGTSVASFPNGWAWWATPGNGKAVLQMTVSPVDSGSSSPSAGKELFFKELKKIPEAESWLRNAMPAGPISKRNSTPSHVSPPVRENSMRVGDAAVTGDPLSGQGHFAAVGGALAAVAVTNTHLRRPANAALARQFFEERCTSLFRSHARMGSEFYATETRWPESPFWATRRNWYKKRTASDPFKISRPHLAEKPVIEDDFVVSRKVVVTADHPRGVWKIADVPLADLLEVLKQSRNQGLGDDLNWLASASDHSPDNVRLARDWLRRNKME